MSERFSIFALNEPNRLITLVCYHGNQRQSSEREPACAVSRRCAPCSCAPLSDLRGQGLISDAGLCAWVNATLSVCLPFKISTSASLWQNDFSSYKRSRMKIGKGKKTGAAFTLDSTMPAFTSKYLIITQSHPWSKSCYSIDSFHSVAVQKTK